MIKLTYQDGAVGVLTEEEISHIHNALSDYETYTREWASTHGETISGEPVEKEASTIQSAMEKVCIRHHLVKELSPHGKS